LSNWSSTAGSCTTAAKTRLPKSDARGDWAFDKKSGNVVTVCSIPGNAGATFRNSAKHPSHPSEKPETNFPWAKQSSPRKRGRRQPCTEQTQAVQ
jgi:hypothetical protein